MNSEDIVVDESFDFEFDGAVDACADESYMPPALPDEVEKRIEAHIAAFDPLLWEICAPEKNLGDDHFHAFDIDALGTPPEAPSGELLGQVSGCPAWREFQFESYALEEVYGILSRRIVEYDLGCLFVAQTTGDATSVVLCNSWRLTKQANSTEIRIEVKDFDSGGWVAGDTWNLPDIMLLPKNANRTLARQSLEMASYLFANTFRGATTAERSVLAGVSEPELSIYSMRHALADTTVRSFEERFGTKQLNSLSETVSSAVGKLLIDPAFMKVVRCAMKFRSVSFSDYIWMAKSHLRWTRLYKEERKLLPILTLLQSAELDKPEPLSIKRWTKEGVELAWPCQKIIRLSGPASYRALLATDPAIVREWAEISCESGAFATLFDLQARIAEEGRIPQQVIWSIVAELKRYRHRGYERCESEQFARLIRQYVRECRRRSEMPAYGNYGDAIASIAMGNVLDWWDRAGMPAGEPNRRTTWSGIERKSNQWHAEAYKAGAKSRKLAWESVLSACAASEVNVESVMTVQHLAHGRIEGDALGSLPPSIASE